MEVQTDSFLMKRIQAGDTSQLAALFERHHQSLYQYLLYLSRNRTLSEDLVQEVFFRVLKYAHTFDAHLAFPVWIYGMGRNAYFDWLHKRRKEVHGMDLNEVRSPETLPEEMAKRKQDAALLQAALAKLPEDKREVLVLSRFHNMPYTDIARVMQCEVGTVKVRVYRALKELRQLFAQAAGEKTA